MKTATAAVPTSIVCPPAWPGFDFRNPDYLTVARARMESLERLRAEGPEAVDALKAYYRDGNIPRFIEDWGWTYDPRNAEPENEHLGLPATMPFILFDKQREYVEWMIRKWRERKGGLVEKSRDCGVSWLDVAISAAVCVLYDGVRVGHGSRLADYVDKVDEPKSIFWKGRFFMRHLPEEFRAGWVEGVNSPQNRMFFPETGSSWVGEAGDDIGRGDRTSMYFNDEAAHHPRQHKVQAALSQTTNCQIDVSSVNGPNNPFAQKRHSGRVEVFIFDWRDDPRKDQKWYDDQVASLDPIVVAQEIDRDYQASVEGVLIPAKWIKAAIGAAARLGLVVTGEKTLGFDVADGGKDSNAAVGGQGVEISVIKQWHGSKDDGEDIFNSVEKVFDLCDEHAIPGFRYDGDGLGAGVRGDARIINERRQTRGQRLLDVEIYRGSDAVLEPEAEDEKGRKNEDFFANRKAQMWWRARKLFQNTYRWVEHKVPCSPDSIISLRPDMPLLHQLVAELGQPQFRKNDAGKLLVLKTPDGMKSPNLADAAIIKMARMDTKPINWTPDMVRSIVMSRGGGRLRRRRY